jgi:hypothetical protein
LHCNFSAGEEAARKEHLLKRIIRVEVKGCYSSKKRVCHREVGQLGVMTVEETLSWGGQAEVCYGSKKELYRE